jgi:hypothetical protein
MIVVWVLGGIAFVILSVATCGFLLESFFFIRRRDRFVSVFGVINRSSIEERRDPESGQEEYAAAIEYEYLASGTHLTGKRFRLLADELTWHCDRAAEEALVNLYRVGSRVTVYFDPVHPEYSTLSLHSNASFIRLGFLAIFCAAVGTVSFLQAFDVIDLISER